MKNDRIPTWATDFLLAACLLSRLPLPTLPPTAFENGARAVWAYPLVGLLLSAVIVLAGGALMSVGMPAAMTAGLVIAALALLTGAMHEDGLSDCADGFWGGHAIERRLQIMKDSQIGSFGTVALTTTIGLRWVAYALLLPMAPGAIVAAAALSRAMMPILMQSLPHARATGLARSVGQPTLPGVLAGLGIALGAAVLLTGVVAFGALFAGVGSALAMRWLAARKIGGQTGDVLGATQQVSEIAILCICVMALT